MNYIVVWLYNSRWLEERYMTRIEAEFRMAQLEIFGFTPSLHVR